MLHTETPFCKQGLKEEQRCTQDSSASNCSDCVASYQHTTCKRQICASCCRQYVCNSVRPLY